MKTRSRGTSTSSKMTNASCSSKRLESGWSKRTGPRATAVAAQELQAGRRHRDRERQRVASAPSGQRVRRIHGDLVGERGQRRQDARAAHDDAVRGVVDLVQRDVVAGRGTSPRALSIVGWMIVCVSERSRRRSSFWNATRLAAPRSLPSTRPLVGAPGEAGERHVQVVGRAAHEPDACTRRCARGSAWRRSRSALERGIMWLTLIGSPVSGSGIRQTSACLVLQVEELGHGPRRAREGRDGRRRRARARRRPRSRVVLSPSRNCFPVRAGMRILPASSPRARTAANACTVLAQMMWFDPVRALGAAAQTSRAAASTCSAVASGSRRPSHFCSRTR